MSKRPQKRRKVVTNEEDGSSKQTLPEQGKDGVFANGRFHDLGLSESLADHIHGRLGFEAPTYVQQAAIPHILSGRDVLVNAGTGTGKTVVYLAPIVHVLQARAPKITRADGTFAIVLVPTRELCVQVLAVAEQLVHRFHWIVPGHVMGGENRAKEKARLRKGINILIATPGRLLDHLNNTASFCYEKLKWLIFDEADRLLDLGFEKDLNSILSFFKSQHAERAQASKQQRILLSATLNEAVNRLVNVSLDMPLKVSFENEALEKNSFQRKLTRSQEVNQSNKEVGIQYNIPGQLNQRVMKVPTKLRLVSLLGYLRLKFSGNGSFKVVVFFSTCSAVDFHHAIINRFHWSSMLEQGNEEKGTFLDCGVFSLHGSMTQSERMESFNTFGKAKRALLLCTDVAARGLDFQGIGCIVQYDPPGEAVEYVHRVGRTARLGQKGEAVLFLQPCESEYLQELLKHGVSLKDLSLLHVLDHAYPAKRRHHSEVLLVDMHQGALLCQTAIESLISSQMDLKQLAADAFRAYARAYTTYRGDLKRIFQVKRLHLGHIAKSFGLKDTPSLIGRSGKKQAIKKLKKQGAHIKSRDRKKLKAARMLE